eukprot:scaffold202287_cov17-Prasinocladus_malaysianus.AAC.2
MAHYHDIQNWHICHVHCLSSELIKTPQTVKCARQHLIGFNDVIWNLMIILHACGPAEVLNAGWIISVPTRTT